MSFLTLMPIILLLFAAAEAATVYNFQGKITDKAGKPVTSWTRVTFRLYTTQTGGTPVWTEQKEVIPDSQGRMQAKLGETSSLKLLPDNYYVEVQIGTETMTPRQYLDLGPGISPAIIIRRKYERFLSDHPEIAGAIKWHRLELEHPYPSWDRRRKDDLFRYLIIYENGEDYPYSAPPVPVPGSSSVARTKILEEDAWNIFIANVAFSLYIEVNRLVPWSITTYSAIDLEQLFDSNSMFFQDRLGSIWIRGITDWNPLICYRFLLSKGMIRSTPWDTLTAFSNWGRMYLVHWQGEYTEMKEYYHYDGIAPIEQVLTPRWEEGNKWHSFIYGCLGTARLYVAILRSVNIPADERGSIPEPSTRDGEYVGHHVGCIFTSLNKAVIHGDDLYGHRLGLYTVPFSEILISADEFSNYHEDPPRLSVEEAYNNANRWVALLIYNNPDDHIIINRCFNLLHSPRYGSAWQYYDEELADLSFSDAEKIALTDRIDEIIEREGGPENFIARHNEYVGSLYPLHLRFLGPSLTPMIH